MNNKHKWYDVIVAWASGEKIQFKCESSKEWEDFCSVNTPDFNSYAFEYQWRIKPNTVTKRYRMALVGFLCESSRNVIAVETTYSTIDDPVEYNTPGFIRWVGDIAEVEMEV